MPDSSPVTGNVSLTGLRVAMKAPKVSPAIPAAEHCLRRRRQDRAIASETATAALRADLADGRLAPGPISTKAALTLQRAEEDVLTARRDLAAVIEKVAPEYLSALSHPAATLRAYIDRLLDELDEALSLAIDVRNAAAIRSLPVPRPISGAPELAALVQAMRRELTQ